MRTQFNTHTRIPLRENAVPNKGKSFERKAKILTFTAAAGLAYLVYANYIRPIFHGLEVPPSYYPAQIDYIKNARMCDKGYDLPGCKNRIYCRDKDPAFRNKYPERLLTPVCINEPILDAPIMLEEAREDMRYDIKKYMKSRDIFEKIYDDAMDLLYPAKPEQPTKKMSVEEYREMQDRFCGRQQEA